MQQNYWKEKNQWGNGLYTHTVLRGDPISQISEDQEVLLPASDQEEEGEDDKEGEATDCCCDDDQHLALIGSDVRC